MFTYSKTAPFSLLINIHGCVRFTIDFIQKLNPALYSNKWIQLKRMIWDLMMNLLHRVKHVCLFVCVSAR